MRKILMTCLLAGVFLTGCGASASKNEQQTNEVADHEQNATSAPTATEMKKSDATKKKEKAKYTTIYKDNILVDGTKQKMIIRQNKKDITDTKISINNKQVVLKRVSITALTKSDLLKNAKTAKNATENAQNTENMALAEYQDKIDQYIESGRDVALSDEVKSYIDNKISEVEKVEITELASDWILTYNNSVKKGDMVYLEFALSKQTSWSNGWNNNIAKISVLSNENTHELTLNAWEGKGTGEIWLNNGDISVCEFGMYGSVENTIVVNATFYIGEK